MQINKIKPILFPSMNETGRAMALISKDSERTFATYLGAAVDLSVEDISHDLFEGMTISMLKGTWYRTRICSKKHCDLQLKQGLNNMP